MSFLVKHFYDILAMDWQTLAVIVVLCGGASYFIKEYLSSPPLVILVFPVLVLFSILAQYLFVQLELFPPKKIDQWLMWTILASIVGTIVGLGLVAGLISLRERMDARRT
jgi:hypothetical protein